MSSSPERATPPLSDGDRLNVSITEEVVYEGRRIYLKYEANVSVMPGEPDGSAARRAIATAIHGISDTIDAYYNWKES